jgi:hypothetical protein
MHETWIIASNVFRQLLRNRILVVLTLWPWSEWWSSSGTWARRPN